MCRTNNTPRPSQIHPMAFQSVGGVQAVPLQGFSPCLNAHPFCNPRLQFRGYTSQQMTMYMILHLQNRYPPPRWSVRNSAYLPFIPSPFSGMSCTRLFRHPYLYFVLSKHSRIRIFLHPGFRHIHRSYLYTCSGGRHLGFDDSFCHRV